ncbi:MAG TPA: hypothetical protein PLS66_06995 [Tepiditoga sp.]|nr:hypothetical protein [Thermotogota bacterium]HOO75022.1 hypothetical protein [Tepiditoga sp.]
MVKELTNNTLRIRFENNLTVKNLEKILKEFRNLEKIQKDIIYLDFSLVDEMDELCFDFVLGSINKSFEEINIVNLNTSLARRFLKETA